MSNTNNQIKHPTAIDGKLHIRQNKIKVKHGTFVENPRCRMCHKKLTHKWIDGDYTLLMCGDEKCWDKLKK